MDYQSFARSNKKAIKTYLVSGDITVNAKNAFVLNHEFLSIQKRKSNGSVKNSKIF